MSENSPFVAPPPSVKDEILASRTDSVVRLDYLFKQSRKINYVLAAVAVVMSGAAAYAISKEKVVVAAYTRDEVGFEHYYFLDTKQVNKPAVIMSLKHFVEDWRTVTVDPEHNKHIRWRAFSRVNLDASERQKIFERSIAILPPQKPSDTHITYVKNITAVGKVMNAREWRVDWDEFEQDISLGSNQKMEPKRTSYSADVVVTIVEPSEQFPDGIMFEPMLPEPVKRGGESQDASKR